MIQKIVYDDDDNMAFELDAEGINYLIEGLNELLFQDVGQQLTTPTVWGKSSPWWRFWDRQQDPIVGEFRLRRVG